MMKAILSTLSISILAAGLMLFASTSEEASLDSIKKNEVEHAKVLASLVSKFSQFGQVDFAVERKSLQSMLGRTKTSEGKMSLSQSGKFWWKIEKPQNTLLVFDGSFAWNEEKVSEDLGGGIKVAKSKHFKASPAYKVLQVLMGKGSLTELFTPLKTSREADYVELQLTPKKKDWNISVLHIKINEKDLNLKSISYFDDLENKTELTFSSPEYHKKEDQKKFNYTPPKNAEITEL
jgi:outer membrane lipoprotein carrier protein